MVGVLQNIKEGILHTFHHEDPLLDSIRNATAKTLTAPGAALNAEAVEKIRTEVAGGRDVKDVVTILKERLKIDNPHKQWLAVVLVDKVLTDLAPQLGEAQDELLLEVAHVLLRACSAGPKETLEAAKAARDAAKELLRAHGRAGANAFRAASTAAQRATPGSRGYHGPGMADMYSPELWEGGVAEEAQGTLQDLRALVAKAHADAELLKELTAKVTAAAPAKEGQAEFDAELVRHVKAEIREVRARLSADVALLQGQAGPAPLPGCNPGVDDAAAVELAVMRALQALDELEDASAATAAAAAAEPAAAPAATYKAAVAGGAEVQAAA